MWVYPLLSVISLLLYKLPDYILSRNKFCSAKKCYRSAERTNLLASTTSSCFLSSPDQVFIKPSRCQDLCYRQLAAGYPKDFNMDPLTNQRSSVGSWNIPSRSPPFNFEFRRRSSLCTRKITCHPSRPMSQTQYPQTALASRYS